MFKNEILEKMRFVVSFKNKFGPEELAFYDEPTLSRSKRLLLPGNCEMHLFLNVNRANREGYVRYCKNYCRAEY